MTDGCPKPFLHSVVRVAIDLGLLEYLCETGPGGRTAEDLVAKTQVDEILLRKYCMVTLDVIGDSQVKHSLTWRQC